MTPPQGPGSPFQLLFSDAPEGGSPLPEAFRRIYPGGWRIPDRTEHPYIYSNFATSRDGRITYQIPELEGGADVTGYDAHDAWLMGLLRARADAVINGDVTVALEPETIWSAEDIFPDEAAAFGELRRSEGRRAVPLQVILSFEANLNFEAACFGREDLHVIVATTTRGAANAGHPHCPATVDVLDLGKEAADLPRLVEVLQGDYGVRSLLCEGGAHVFANMLDARLIDEEFVTLCPRFIGRDAAQPRPSYTEGVAWRPENAPYSKPLSLHRAGDLLFLRTQCRYQG